MRKQMGMNQAPDTNVFTAYVSSTCHVQSANLHVGHLPTLDDEALLVLVAQREYAALGALYDRYHRIVFALALRITNNRLAAEETLQEVFHEIWLQANHTTHVGFTTWITNSTRQYALQIARLDKGTLQDDVLGHTPGGSQCLEEQLLQLPTLHKCVHDALIELPSAHREAIELAFYDGLKCFEIAARVQAPIATIQIRLRLGMQQLRTALGAVLS